MVYGRYNYSEWGIYTVDPGISGDYDWPLPQLDWRVINLGYTVRELENNIYIYIYTLWLFEVARENRQVE